MLVCMYSVISSVKTSLIALRLAMGVCFNLLPSAFYEGLLLGEEMFECAIRLQIRWKYLFGFSYNQMNETVAKKDIS